MWMYNIKQNVPDRPLPGPRAMLGFRSLCPSSSRPTAPLLAWESPSYVFLGKLYQVFCLNEPLLLLASSSCSAS